MANGGQVEGFVVVSACVEHRAIAQSRCLGLTGTDIHIYIHTYIYTNGGRQRITITCLAFPIHMPNNTITPKKLLLFWVQPLFLYRAHNYVRDRLLLNDHDRS